MNTLNTTFGRQVQGRQAASLAQTASWYLHRFGQWLEQAGQRRAGPELARAAERMAVTHPELAARLAAQARRCRAR